MVKLTKIVVCGFKSFKRKASIPVQPGVSVFTGPNGSGKTNVADAITFVLGRSQARSLRAKKAQNLIFHGSDKKEASDYASVALHFDNSRKVLPVSEPEVVISRRINVNGVSTYRVNGKAVTRQQLIDTLHPAGLHPDSHNIIQQGDVNQIVEMSPSDRRRIIDEISGIAEYDDKKRKAEAELAVVDSKVKEAEIIIREKALVVERLGKERNAAMQYKQLTDDLQRVKTAMLVEQAEKASHDYEAFGKQLEKKEKEMADLNSAIDKIEKDIAEQEAAMERLTKDVLKSGEEVEVEKQIARLNGEMERLKDKIDSNKREMLRIENFTERLRSSDQSAAVRAVAGMEGVKGVVADLIRVPSAYRVAVEVAAGSKLQNVVVDRMETAVKGVKHLKERKLGRAVFLPLDKLSAAPKRPLPAGCIGWLSALVQYDPGYSVIAQYVLGTTACVEDIDKARQIANANRVRLVTLDGDLIEASGAVIGGYYRKPEGHAMPSYDADKKKLVSENLAYSGRIGELEKELSILLKKTRKRIPANIEMERAKIDGRIKRLREERRVAAESRLALMQDMSRVKIESTKVEATVDNLNLQTKDADKGQLKTFLEKGITELKETERLFLKQLSELGNVNLKSLDDFDSIKAEFDDFRGKLDQIVAERNSILGVMASIEEKRMATFMEAMQGVAKHFKTTYKDLTGGDAELALEDSNSLDSGLLIKASPAGKKLLDIDSMSGGEKTLTAFAFLFAIQKHRPVPFYILDEADAALDKRNSRRVAELLSKHKKDTQFIVISHNDEIIRYADQVYGVSMDNGESKIFGIKLPEEVVAAVEGKAARQAG